MDRQALRFIDMLNNDDRDENGNDKIDIALKMKLFQMGQDWLIRRKKLRPDDGPTEGEGIRDMRAWMSDPAARESLKTMMFEEGFVKIPEPKAGRPTKQEELVRQRYKAHKESSRPPAPDDDSGWQGLLSDPKGEA